MSWLHYWHSHFSLGAFRVYRILGAYCGIMNSAYLVILLSVSKLIQGDALSDQTTLYMESTATLTPMSASENKYRLLPTVSKIIYQGKLSMKKVPMYIVSRNGI